MEEKEKKKKMYINKYNYVGNHKEICNNILYKREREKGGDGV